MRVALLSMFSTSTSYLERYFEQMVQLRAALEAQGDRLRLILCEGDSTDDTFDQIQSEIVGRGLSAIMLQHHHGNRVFGSLEIPARFAQLSRIWNEMLESVSEHTDRVIIVESDLIWDADTMMELLHHSLTLGGIVAPMVMEGNNYFRDVWAFRRHGQRFTNEPPYHRDLATLPGALLQLDSAGSCLVMPAEVARTCRTTEEEELVGFCNQARANGYSIWVDPGLSVQHPPDRLGGHRDGAARYARAVRV